MIRSLGRNPSRFHLFPFSTTTRLHTTTQSTAGDAAAAAAAAAASYLVASWGLSQTDAASTAAKLSGRLASPTKPDAVLRLLESHGFTRPHLARLVTKRPNLLLADPDKILKPKLDFLVGLGLGVNSISANPSLLNSSLDRRLRTNLASLSTALGSPEVAAAVLKRSPRFLNASLETRLIPNLDILRRCGVQSIAIVKMVTAYPWVLLRRPTQLAEEIERLIEMGFEPSSPMFRYAVVAMSGSKAATWKQKIAAYGDIGWSEAEALAAFRRFPFVMLISVEKIKKMAVFYAEELGWGKDVILVNPYFLSISLEKRVLPRMLVWRILSSKGVVKSQQLPRRDLTISEEDFMEKYVDKYGKKYPEVYEAYRGKIGAGGAKQKHTDQVALQ